MEAGVINQGSKLIKILPTTIDLKENSVAEMKMTLE